MDTDKAYIVVHFHAADREEGLRTFPNSKRGRELAEIFADRRRNDKHGPEAVSIEYTDENKGIVGQVHLFESICGLDDEDEWDEE